MWNFLDLIDNEIMIQKKRLQAGKRYKKVNPKGHLRYRPRKKGGAFYHVKQTGHEIREQNISEEPQMIRKLFQKRIGEELVSAAEKNILALERLKQCYQPDEFFDIMREIPQAYKEAATFLGEEQTLVMEGKKTIQENFNPKYHRHDTICGLKVRSKSEVIIANALTSYGIPFIYEKQFHNSVNPEKVLLPDFTFELPSGEIKLWEHLGMLEVLEYCEHNAYKLYVYQKQGFYVGRNLLITQDDNNGNCNSAFIDEVIRKELLPYYR